MDCGLWVGEFGDGGGWIGRWVRVVWEVQKGELRLEGKGMSHKYMYRT